MPSQVAPAHATRSLTTPDAGTAIVCGERRVATGTLGTGGGGVVVPGGAAA